MADNKQDPKSEAPVALNVFERRFLAVWRWLDDTPLRQVWPFALGVGMAVVAVRVSGNAIFGTLIVALVYYGLTRVARKIVAHEEAVRKIRD